MTGKWGRLSFKKKLLLYSLFLCIVPLPILGTLSYYTAVANVEEEVNRSQQIILGQIEQQLTGFMKRLEMISVHIATDPNVLEDLRQGPLLDPLDSITTLNVSARQYRAVSDIRFKMSLLYTGFKMVYSEEYGQIQAKRFPLANLLDLSIPIYPGSVIVPPKTYANQKDMILLRSIPVQSSPAEQIGTLMLEVNTNSLFDVLRSTGTNENEGRQVLVIDDLGRIIVSSNYAEVGTMLTPGMGLYDFWMTRKAAYSHYNSDQIEYKLNSIKSAFNDWTYMTITPTKELRQRANHIKQFTWTMTGILTGVWLIFSIIGTQRFSFPFKRMYEKLPELQENTLLKMLRGEPADKDFVLQNNFLQTCFWFYIIVIERESPKASVEADVPDQGLSDRELAALLQVLVKKRHPCLFAIEGSGKIVFVVGIADPDEDGDQAMFALGTLLLEEVKRQSGDPAALVIGRGFRHYRQLGEKFREAEDLIGYKFILGTEKVITAQMTESFSVKQSNRFFVKWHKMIVTSIIEGEVSQAAEHFEMMIAQLSAHVPNPELILGSLNYLMGEIDTRLQEMGHDLSELIDDERYDQLSSLPSIEHAKSWFCTVFFPALERHLEQFQQQGKKRLTRELIEYMELHYDQDLSLQLLSDRFAVSSSHISRLIKNETGYSFVEYLIQLRISKAKEWLAHTDMALKEISERLRYTNSQNFSRIFKQVTGMPPGKYRNQSRD
ncbi:helix-turn-helix domain-containing protein [Paenibacillus eucommiae]|uniref:AraC-like DNA-binding protein n=1 Tax=Paenibacillus eucommiae TaxID=1355755 RepID=A0ABS4ILH4_9BACL|nr:helix-turn-helix domain-containing protein [Paenibacillus eucommiae]MBP1988419.1 AraC-like DNA-binding protein [Paenibacillus eucommiae]